jgi:hypothetical protein
MGPIEIWSYARFVDNRQPRWICLVIVGIEFGRFERNRFHRENGGCKNQVWPRRTVIGPEGGSFVVDVGLEVINDECVLDSIVQLSQASRVAPRELKKYQITGLYPRTRARN